MSAEAKRFQKLARHYGLEAVLSIKDLKHAMNMVALAEEVGRPTTSGWWAEDLLRQEAAAVGNARMAAHYALLVQEEVSA